MGKWILIGAAGVVGGWVLAAIGLEIALETEFINLEPVPF